MFSRRLLAWRSALKRAPRALILCTLGTLSTSAFAASPQFRNIEIGGGFDVETIFVEQEDDMWRRISNHPRTIPVHVTIEMSRGFIQFYRVGRQLTNGAVRGVSSTHTIAPDGYAKTDNRIEAHVNSRTSVVGPVNILIDEFTRLNAGDEQAIINQCNAKWTEVERGHSFSYSLPLAMHADARENRRLKFPFYLNEYEGYGDFARASATGFVGLKVVCLGQDVKYPRGDSKAPSDSGGIPRSSGSDTPKAPGGQDLGFNQGPMTVNDIRLTLTTYSNAYTEPTPGTTCKKAKLRVTMETNQEGPVSFKLWGKRGDGAVESEEIDLQAQHDEGYFRAVHERWVEVDETTNVQFNARDLVNETFNKETGWKDITLHCTGAGGGGLANPTGDNDDDVPKQTAFEGNFEFIDNGPLAQQNSCPRDAKALVWFNAPKADNIHYSLDCGALGNFSGVLQPDKVASGHYRAGKLINFSVTDTIEAGCTLRSVSPGDARDHAFKANAFQCAKAAGHSAGIDGFTGSKKDPGHDLPKPKPQVNPVFGGSVEGLTAVPNPTHAPQRGSPDKPATKPEKKTEPARTNPKPTKPRLVCIGGKITKKSCQCGPNKIRRKTGNASYQCIAVAKPPEKREPVRANPTGKKAQLVCKNGRISNGKCQCGPKRKLVKTGKKAFACQANKAVRADPAPAKRVTQPKRATPPQTRQNVVCKGGVVRGGQCRCGRNKVANKTGPRRFVCVRPRG